MSTLKVIFELSGISFIIYQGSVRFSDEKVSLLFILYHHSKWYFKVSKEYGKNCVTNLSIRGEEKPSAIIKELKNSVLLPDFLIGKSANIWHQFLEKASSCKLRNVSTFLQWQKRFFMEASFLTRQQPSKNSLLPWE